MLSLVSHWSEKRDNANPSGLEVEVVEGITKEFHRDDAQLTLLKA